MAFPRLDADAPSACSARFDSAGASGSKRLGQRRERLDDMDDIDDPNRDPEREHEDDDDNDNNDDESGEPTGENLDDDLDPFDPDDDADLGLDSVEDENVGLDTAVGFDESGDDLGLTDLDGEEEDSWQSDGDQVDDDVPDLETDLEDEDEESGWVEDETSSGFDEDDLDDDIDDEPADTGADDGAEGVEDDTDLDDLDLAVLPVLDINAEEEVGLPGFDGSDELGGVGLLDEPMVEIGPGQSWKILRARTTRTTRVAWPRGCGVTRPDGTLAAGSLATRGETLYVASGGLYRLPPQATAFTALPLREADSLGKGRASAPYAQTVTLAEHEGTLHLAVIAGDQLHFSGDAGRSFSVQESPRVSHAGFTHAASGLRLRWCTADGQLGSDGGTSTRPGGAGSPSGKLSALHADGHRSVAWLEQRGEQLQLTASADAGKTCSVWRLPGAISKPGRMHLETSGQAVLLVAAGEARCAVPGAELEVIASGARPPATLADEEGEAFVFACVEREAEWLIIRRAARANRAAPLVLASIRKQDLGMPLAMAVGYGDDGMLSLFVASKEALLRIEASLDGEELA
jgi:hypothetical protein